MAAIVDERRAAARYSPELNPIENLWHYLKSHYWSNRAYDNHEALEESAIAAWHHAVLDAPPHTNRLRRTLHHLR